MTRAKKLISNTLIFALGTFGSKFLQYLLLPFYTALLTTSEYGIIDNLQNIGALCVPIVSLTISESIFRYTMDSKNKKSDVYSIGTGISLIGLFIFFIICLILSFFVDFGYIWILYFYVLSNILRTNASQYTRAIEKTKLYAIDNIVQTLIILVTNIIMLSVLKWGIQGYMLAYIIGNISSFIFLTIAGKLYKDLRFRIEKRELVGEMVHFSLPLIPNTICWWISNCSDRFMITAMINAAANGVYAIAYKIPTVMTILINIFLQAWQISANEESEKADISHFYSEMFNYISALLSFMTVGICTLSQVIILVITNENYYEAWYYIPVLALSVFFFAKAQFLGTVYTTFKQTKMAFYSNLIAAIFNIIGNYFLIQYIGVLGAAISTAFSYFVLWIVRYFNIQQFVKLKVNMKKEVISLLLVLFDIFIVMADLGIMTYIAFIIIMAIFVVLYKNEIFTILKKLKR